MIDLRSDTLSMPTEEMLATILTAKLGDDGRVGEDGKGEDATVNELERLAASLTGKEDALIMSTGTMGNTVALLTHCKPQDKVLLDCVQHTYRTEKIAYDKSFGQLEAVFYKTLENGLPDMNSVQEKIRTEEIKLLCLENTHNTMGGLPLPMEMLQELSALAAAHNIPVHMDGARLFNAALALQVEAKDICNHVDTVMFCLSKGLSAPIGSVLCGSRDFIKKARGKRKILGSNMRQAGIIAAPAIYALNHLRTRLQEDHDNAAILAEQIQNLRCLKLLAKPQSNIVMVGVGKSGLTASNLAARLKNKGVWTLTSGNNQVRMVFYRGITADMAREAGKIVRELDAELLASTRL